MVALYKKWTHCSNTWGNMLEKHNAAWWLYVFFSQDWDLWMSDWCIYRAMWWWRLSPFPIPFHQFSREKTHSATHVLRAIKKSPHISGVLFAIHFNHWGVLLKCVRVLDLSKGFFCFSGVFWWVRTNSSAKQQKKTQHFQVFGASWNVLSLIYDQIRSHLLRMMEWPVYLSPSIFHVAVLPILFFWKCIFILMIKYCVRRIF